MRKLTEGQPYHRKHNLFLSPKKHLYSQSRQYLYSTSDLPPQKKREERNTFFTRSLGCTTISMMKTNHFKNMLAAVVALFITTLALPLTAQAQEETNYVTIDEVDKEILSTDFLKGDGDEHSFVVYLYLSADKKEYVKVSGNKNRHAIYKTVLLEDYESAHEGEAYWEVVYTKEGSEKVCFHAGGNPNAKYVCFSGGNMKISGAPRPTRKVCSISISDADITDNKHGDGQPHSLYVDYKYEREDPTAGTLSLGSATESSLTFNWTPASDNVTPQDKLRYNLIVTADKTIDWKSVELSGVTSYTFVDLKPDTKYKAELYVVDESDNSKSYEDLLVSTTSGSLVPYDLWVAGRQVTSKNCNDLSAIDGVSGTAKYDPDTKTLTLDNANITYSAKEGYGLQNEIDGLTLHLVGNNTLASEKGIGLLNRRDRSLIFNGEGKLTVKGAMTGKEGAQTGMSNWGIITVKDCTLKAEGGVSGLEGGQWIFENCTVRAKGGGSVNLPNIGSFGHLFKKVPEFKGCAIVLPVGAVWKKVKRGNDITFYLFTKDGDPVTDWVEISTKPTSAQALRTDAPTRCGIFTLTGVRLDTSFNRLPAGVYIVDGKKMVKP